MPQGTIFEGWQLTTMTFVVELPVNTAGGRVSLRLQDQNGRPAGGQTVQWNAARDLNDLSLVARDVTAAFLWAPHLEVRDSLRPAMEKHCPRVPDLGGHRR